MSNETNWNEIYPFLYLEKPQSQFFRWIRKNPELQSFGQPIYFAGILCPVSTANVEVMERTRAEYDTIEFVILKLFASGLQKADILASITGLELEMVKNVLSILENTYHHIEGKKVTEEGQQSLKDRRNIQCYQTTKQVQFEAITGTVLQPVLFQAMAGAEAYYFAYNQDKVRRILPKHYIERDVREDIMQNFDRHRSREIIERNVEKILEVTVEECRYTEAFLVKYDYLPHPFVVFPQQSSKSVTWIPVAVSESNAKVLKSKGFNFDYYNFELAVRPDKEFLPLVDIEKEYKLVVPANTLEKSFKIGPKSYEIAPKDSPDAIMKLHSQTGITPVWCVETADESKAQGEQEAEQNVDM